MTKHFAGTPYGNDPVSLLATPDAKHPADPHLSVVHSLFVSHMEATWSMLPNPIDLRSLRHPALNGEITAGLHFDCRFSYETEHGRHGSRNGAGD